VKVGDRIEEAENPTKSVRLKTAATGLRPWIYRKMVAPAPGVADGELVTIIGKEGGVVGAGFYNRKSQIGLRVVRWGPEPCDDEFLRRRIRDALYLRRSTLQLEKITNAYRAVNSEGDDLSGLIVDVYGDVATIEIHSLAWYRRLALVEEALRGELRLRGVVVRVGEKVERAEGFEARVESWESPAASEFTERGLRFHVDFSTGHKTGAFLDQRDNRELLSRYVANKDVLDICCYQGGFALAASVLGGAGRVVAVDLDEKAIAVAKKNAETNKAKRLELVHDDGFRYMRACVEAKRRYDVVVLDPPKLAPSVAELPRAAAKYTDFNELGMKVLKNHGLLMTCSCSGLVSEEMFMGLLRKAAARAERRIRILGVTGAAPDHPVSPHFPEGRYLKCVLASVESL
jgi:23S rRNA (cytosine1962-C5)-methyltransferase